MAMAVVLVLLVVGSLLFHYLSPWYFTPLASNWETIDDTVSITFWVTGFVFVALSGPLVPRIRRSPVAGAVLDGVNVASLALMSVVTWLLARSAIVDVGRKRRFVVSLSHLSDVARLGRSCHRARGGGDQIVWESRTVSRPR